MSQIIAIFSLIIHCYQKTNGTVYLKYVFGESVPCPVMYISLLSDMRNIIYYHLICLLYKGEEQCFFRIFYAITLRIRAESPSQSTYFDAIVSQQESYIVQLKGTFQSCNLQCISLVAVVKEFDIYWYKPGPPRYDHTILVISLSH